MPLKIQFLNYIFLHVCKIEIAWGFCVVCSSKTLGIIVIAAIGLAWTSGWYIICGIALQAMLLLLLLILTRWLLSSFLLLMSFSGEAGLAFVASRCRQGNDPALLIPNLIYAPVILPMSMFTPVHHYRPSFLSCTPCQNP